MKLIFNRVCILMKQAGDDTRPPLRDANKAASRSDGRERTHSDTPAPL